MENLTEYHKVSLSFLGLLTFAIICYGLVSLTAISGNSLVIWIVSTRKNLQDVINQYVSNLAISDILLALFCIPFQFYAAFMQRWDLPQFMCKFCPFVQTMSINVNILTLLVIAKERYYFQSFVILYTKTSWDFQVGASHFKIFSGTYFLVTRQLQSWILRPCSGWRYCFHGHSQEIKDSVPQDKKHSD